MGCSPTTPCSRSSGCSASSPLPWWPRPRTTPVAPTSSPTSSSTASSTMAERGIRPRDIVTPASLRNALTVAIAMGGSTNVLLHSVEIARAAGLDLVGRGAQPGRLQRPVPPTAGAREYATLRRLLDGRRRRLGGPAHGGRSSCCRPATSTATPSPARVRRWPDRSPGWPPGPDHRVIYSTARRLQGHGWSATPVGEPRPRGRGDPQVGGGRGWYDRRRLRGDRPGVRRRAGPDRGPRRSTDSRSGTTTWW